MRRYLAIDYGRKRLGLAVSDPLGITAQPAGYLEHTKNVLPALSQFIEEREVNEIVLGLPLHLDGGESEMSKEVQAFGKYLAEKLKLPIHYWKEQFTTAESERLLISADVRRSKRKEVRDAMAAALILQGFLQAQIPPPSESDEA